MVTTNFILESVKAKKLLDIEQYLVFNERKKGKDLEKIEEASDLKSGKITIGITIYFYFLSGVSITYGNGNRDILQLSE